MTWDVQTALVESFALHARGLSDFFFVPKRGRQPNAFAFDYFADDNPSWHRTLAPEQGPWLRRIKLSDRDPAASVDRFGKEIAHLTFEPDVPLADHARGWPVSPIANEIGEVLHVFVRHVVDGKVADDFKASAWREIPVAARVGPAGLGPGMWGRPVAIRPGSRPRG